MSLVLVAASSLLQYPLSVFRGLSKGLLSSICVVLLLFNTANGAEPDITKKEGRSSFRVHVNESSFSFNVTTSLLESFEVFTVPNPPRLVIDAGGLDFKKSSTFPIKGCDLTSLLRVGIHPDKVRFVFDLTQGYEIVFKATSEVSSGNVEVNLKNLAVTAKPTGTSTATPTVTSISPTLEPTIKPTITAEPTSTSEPEPTATPTPTEEMPSKATPTIEPEITEALPTATPVGDTSPLPEGQILKGIAFEREEAGKTPLIRITLTNEPKFKLARANPKLYKLTIPDAIPSGSHLFLPSFPPQDFIGLVSVQASSSGDGTIVFIGVERNEKINAYREGTDIIVKIISH